MIRRSQDLTPHLSAYPPFLPAPAASLGGDYTLWAGLAYEADTVPNARGQSRANATP